MKQILCAVQDLKADMFKFGNYSVFGSANIAVRVFRTNIAEVPVMRHNPADFRLFKLADVEAETGVIIPLSVPELLADGGTETVKE